MGRGRFCFSKLAGHARLTSNVGLRKMSAPNFFHLLWMIPLWYVLAFVACLAASTAIVKWPATIKKIRRFCPYVFVSVFIELAVFHFFDAASAADGIFWVPPLHYLNLIFGVPAFMLMFFEWSFRAAERRRLWLIVPVFFLCAPVLLLQELHDTYIGFSHHS